MRAHFRVAVLLCSFLSVLGPAQARSHRPPAADAGEPGQFDYYLLTLSWSPTYCLVHAEDRYECGGRGYGFVLHGLWPQFDSGGYPENCLADSRLSPAAEAVGRTVYPSPRLMLHEWQRHGTCSGLDAVSYFRAADKALATVRIPVRFSAPRASVTLTSEQIAAEFRAANPRIPENGMTVACSRGELSEIRLCLSRDLTFRSCGRRVRNTCPAVPVEVPASR
jgi:ribonuclease T2